MPETVTLSPLPCWEHLSPEGQKEKIAELVREIEEEAAAQREATGKTLLGRAAILKQHPYEGPNRPKKSYAPLVHAASRKVDAPKAGRRGHLFRTFFYMLREPERRSSCMQ
jgi:hypothetical protein